MSWLWFDGVEKQRGGCPKASTPKALILAGVVRADVGLIGSHCPNVSVGGTSESGAHGG